MMRAKVFGFFLFNRFANFWRKGSHARDKTMPIWVYAGPVAGLWAMVAIVKEMGQEAVGRAAGRDNWLRASR